MGVFAAAPGTDSGELQLIAGDAASGSCVAENFGRQDNAVQIQYLSALGADEMGVRRSGKIVALQPIDHADGLNDSFFLEHGNVPVDRTQTQVGEVRLQLLVDPFGCGVALGIADTVQNSVAFFAVLSDSFHVHLLVDNDYYYGYHFSTDFLACKEEKSKNF